MASPWLYKKIQNFFKDTNTDNVLVTMQLPAVHIGVDPYINSRFFLGPQAASTINPTGVPTGPVVQGDFSIGGLKVYGSQDAKNP